MASRRIQGITIEIDGDTTKLNTALKGVDKQLKTTKSALSDINKLLKLDPGNAKLLTQKQKDLASAISTTKERLTQLKNVSKDALTTEEYDAVQREIVETEANLKNLEKEYKEFGSVSAQQLAAAGEKMKEVGDKIADVGTGLTTHVTLPLVAVGTAAAASFAEVDKTMQLTNKTMGNTEEEAKLLDTAMKEAAANSTFGMTDAATATLNFARAGLDAAQAADTLAPAMNLAAGEGGNLDTVSAGLVATINGFHDNFDQAAHYADVFAAACNNSALDVDSLSTAMSVATPIFASAGYQVEDAALYLGIMANNGIDADKAANSLKTGIARLVSPAKQGAQAMSDLGISVTDTDGNMKDSVTIQKELHDAFANLSEAEQIAAASAIFGKNQMAPWLALINTAPEDVNDLSAQLDGASFSTDDFTKQLKASGISLGTMKAELRRIGISSKDFADALNTSNGSAEDFADSLLGASNNGVTLEDIVGALGVDLDTLQGVMDSTKGTTDIMAEAMMSGFGGSIEQVKSSLDVLVTTIGQNLAPYLQKVIDKVQGWVDKFNSLDDGTKEIIVQVGLVVAAIGPALVAIGKVTSGIGSILSLMPNIISFLTGPVGITVAIAGVVAAGVYLVQHWDEVKEKAKEIWEKITKFFSEAWEKIKNIDWAAIGNTIWDGVTTMMADVGTWLKARFDDAFALIRAIDWVQLGKDIWDWIKRAFADIAVWLSNRFVDAANAIANIDWAQVGEDIWDWVTYAFTDIKAWLRNKFENAANAVANINWGDVGNAIWNAIDDALNGIGEWIYNVFKSPLNAVIKLVNNVIGGIESGINAVIDGINDKLSIDWDIPVVGKVKWSPNIKNVHWGRLRELWTGGTLSEGQHAVVGEYAPEYLRVIGGQAVVTPIQGAERGRGGDTVTNNFNIYAQPGQDVRQLANEVQRIMTRQQQQREAAYA